MNQPLTLEPKRVSSGAFWIDADPVGFTALCAKHTNTHVPVDEISNETMQVFQRRCDVLALLIGLRAGATNGAVRCAVSVQRN